MKSLLATVVWAAISLVAPPASAEVAVPYLSGRIVDEAALLTAPTRDRISGMLRSHEEATGNQIAILTIPTLNGESVEDYAIRVFEDWKLGQKDKDNGVLVLVVPQDRRMRIEVGYGLEGTLTDAAASRVIRDLMTPRFREGNFDVGIESGITGILQVLEGRAPRDPEVNWIAPQQGSKLHVDGADMPLPMKILVGLFVFSILGIFTAVGLFTPGGAGWFLYVFLIPFWSMFPFAIFGSTVGLSTIAAHLIGYPIGKMLIGRTAWYRKAREDFKTKGYANVGGMTIRPGGSSSGGFSSGGGFSGGGGRSGGGGASGSW